MDLRKVQNADKLSLCRTYWIAGWAFLPFLWIINSIWFFKEAFVKPPYPEQQRIKGYVIKSGIGGIIWTVVFIAWVIIYQKNRVSWGATGDNIAFILPQGIV